MSPMLTEVQNTLRNSHALNNWIRPILYWWICKQWSAFKDAWEEILIRHNATWSMRPKWEREAIYRNHYYSPCVFGVGKSFLSGVQAIGYIFSDPSISDFHNRERRENSSKSELLGMFSQTTFLFLLNSLVSMDIHLPYLFFFF